MLHNDKQLVYTGDYATVLDTSSEVVPDCLLTQVGAERRQRYRTYLPS